MHDAFGLLRYGLVTYRSPRRANVIRQIMKIKRERTMLQEPAEAYQLYAAASAVREVSGDAAEVGGGRGASAKLMRLTACPNQKELIENYVPVRSLAD